MIKSQMFKNLFAILLIGGTFIFGMKMKEREYNDVCLKLGGSIAEEGFPICVVKRLLKQAKNI